MSKASAKNKELLKEFTLKVKDYCKKYKSIFIKIDPDIIYRKEDNNGEEVKLDLIDDSFIVLDKEKKIITPSANIVNNENENEMVIVPLLRFGNFRPAVRHDGSPGGKEQEDK